jgi:glc operon protein GlcG
MNSIRSLALGFALATAIANAAGAQTAGPRPYGQSLSIEQADRILAAAEAEARRNNWNVVIAIVDTGGQLVSLKRLDNTQTGSIRIAEGKASSAVAFRRPTKALEDSLQTTTRLLSVPGLTALEGGLPIIIDDRIVGGIGVSGVLSSQDAQIASVGIAALAAK